LSSIVIVNDLVRLSYIVTSTFHNVINNKRHRTFTTFVFINIPFSLSLSLTFERFYEICFARKTNIV
jgi:hypothetical protein